MKFLPNGIGDSQKTQIRDSFNRAHENKDFRMKSWTLCLPIDMSVEEKKWFDNWEKTQMHTGIEIQPVWGVLRLEGLLYQEKNRHLREAFFKEGHQQVNAAVVIQGPNAINISGPNAVVLGPNAIKILGSVVQKDEKP